ncbi:hypothetical protein EXIGLDRAFT_829303 [Exidia glandulosa HHB12029]|uniref:Uncharacterized protein n=1 Tax=Exidia glandulosa HHB12029 TaxID=1314781 RepID=A0A165PN85_EXIGL|nr:hypothetical protein EXIGLDRAFT_829303 [Exidia glandulosa HHB12029]
MDFDNPRGFARQMKPSTTTCSTHLISTTDYSLTFCIAAILHRFSWSLVPSFRLCSGATRLSAASVLLGCNEQPENFRDFDIYQLERDRDLFVQFLDWKAGVSLQQPPVVGTVLTIEPNVIERKLFAWRIPPKYHKMPIDAVTEAAVRAEDRVRDRLVDECLSSNDTLSFEITGIKQCGSDLYSQVVIGRIGRGDQKLPHELCLKLYDERFFPVPTLDHWDAGTRPWQRLVQLNFADQLLRREEAVYDRLGERQGTLLPHCYGFHEFTLPNGVRVLGALLELISGESLLSLAKEQWSTWSRAEKVHLAAGANRAAEIDLVLIDFAFAKQQEGFHERTEAVEDVANVQFMLMGLGLDEEAKKEIGWDERDDCEE